MNVNYPTCKGRAMAIVPTLKFVVLGLAMLRALTVEATPPPSGIAPVVMPAGGFSIDGDLMANTPAQNVGDWLLSTNAGSGGSVLDAAGVPLNATNTIHFKDLYNSGTDNTFSGGKWMDNPNAWQ